MVSSWEGHTYVESLLRSHLLHQQDLRYAQFHTDMWNCLSVHEILLQANMPVIQKVNTPNHAKVQITNMMPQFTSRLPVNSHCQKMINAGFRNK